MLFYVTVAAEESEATPPVEDESPPVADEPGMAVGTFPTNM